MHQNSLPKNGDSYGEVIECDVLKGLYKLEFAVDGDVHFMTFEDVLSMLPKSWFGKQARAHQARVIHSLARAAHAACYLGIGNKPIQIAPLLSQKFPDGILWILMPCVLSFQATLPKASVFI